MHRPAFTLVELTVVVLILGILGSIAAGRFMGVSEDATEVMITQQLDAIQDQVEVRTAINSGHAPSSINPSWFHGNSLPRHPQNTFRVSEIQTVTIVDKFHPTNRILHGSSEGAFWYNTRTKVVRARVTWQGSAEETRILYDHVNRTSTDNGGLDDEQAAAAGAGC